MHYTASKFAATLESLDTLDTLEMIQQLDPASLWEDLKDKIERFADITSETIDGLSLLNEITSYILETLPKSYKAAFNTDKSLVWNAYKLKKILDTIKKSLETTNRMGKVVTKQLDEYVSILNSLKILAWILSLLEVK